MRGFLFQFKLLFVVIVVFLLTKSHRQSAEPAATFYRLPTQWNNLMLSSDKNQLPAKRADISAMWNKEFFVKVCILVCLELFTQLKQLLA